MGVLYNAYTLSSRMKKLDEWRTLLETKHVA